MKRAPSCRKEFTWYLRIVHQDWSALEILNYYLAKGNTLPTSLLRPFRRQRAAAPGRRFRRAWNPENQIQKKLSNEYKRFFMTKPPGRIVSSVVRSDPLSLFSSICKRQICPLMHKSHKIPIKKQKRLKNVGSWYEYFSILSTSAVIFNWIIKKKRSFTPVEIAAPMNRIYSCHHIKSSRTQSIP